MVTNNKREIKFKDGVLYLRSNGIEKELGEINTKNGRLTHRQKLLAVQKTGEWVEI